MNYRIVFENGTTFPQPEQATLVVTPLKSGREWQCIAVIGTSEAVKAAFVDGASYRQEWDSVVINEVLKTKTDPETGETFETIELIETTEVQSRDLSEFSVAGEVVDHRDGTCTVLMGKMTEIESLQAQLMALQAEKNSTNI